MWRLDLALTKGAVMSKITNLRVKRKQAAREEKRAQAAANAAWHGRPKAQQDLEYARLAQLARKLEGHKRDG